MTTDNPKHNLDDRRPLKIAKIESEFVEEEEEEEEEEVETQEEEMNPNPRLQRYLVAIEYIGILFSGSQQQLNLRTAVGDLQDAGVHGLGNVCHVDVERIGKRKPDEVLPPHEATVVKKAVNHFLQKNEGGEIMVTDICCVPSNYHARYKVKERIYDAKSPIRTFDELHVFEVASSPYFPSIMERARNNLYGEDPCEFGANSAFGIKQGHRCFVVKARSRSFLYH